MSCFKAPQNKHRPGTTSDAEEAEHIQATQPRLRERHKERRAPSPCRDTSIQRMIGRIKQPLPRQHQRPSTPSLILNDVSPPHGSTHAPAWPDKSRTCLGEHTSTRAPAQSLRTSCEREQTVRWEAAALHAPQVAKRTWARETGLHHHRPEVKTRTVARQPAARARRMRRHVNEPAPAPMCRGLGTTHLLHNASQRWASGKCNGTPTAIASDAPPPSLLRTSHTHTHAQEVPTAKPHPNGPRKARRPNGMDI